MQPIANVNISELKVGDVVTLDWNNNGGTHVEEYVFMTVLAIHDNEVAFGRPMLRIQPPNHEIKPRPFEHYHKINGHLFSFDFEVFTAYQDHKGLNYTVWDSPMNEEEWYYTGQPYSKELENIPEYANGKLIISSALMINS